LAALSDAADDLPHLPIVAVLVGASSPLPVGRRNVPVYELPEDAVRALGHACRYARWRRKPTGSRPNLPGIDRQAAQKIISAALLEGAGWQPVAVAHALMSCYGIPLGETRLATGVELVVGVAHDALFGSLIMVGLGGVHADLLDDRSFRSVPLTDQDAAAMWRELHAAPLLTGYRGLPATDTAALEDMLLRVAQLAEDFPEISKLDLNPVVSVPAGVAALDVKIKLQPRVEEPDPYVRSLATRRGRRNR
jgi:acyl-CoA synthetase (NDP forming)